MVTNSLTWFRRIIGTILTKSESKTRLIIHQKTVEFLDDRK